MSDEKVAEKKPDFVPLVAVPPDWAAVSNGLEPVACPVQPLIQAPVMGQVSTGEIRNGRPVTAAVQTGIQMFFVSCQGRRCPLYMGGQSCSLSAVYATSESRGKL